MIRSLLRVYSLFRPDDTALSSEARSQIQIHRLLTVLGMVLVPLFGLLHGVSNPDATDPTWARLAVTGLFAGLFVASYASRRVRRNYVLWLRGALYVLIGWFALVAALNHFAGDYVAGLLVLYAVLTAGVGVGARSIRPVLWFLGTGLLLTAVGIGIAPALQTSPLILFASMATVTLLEGIAIQAHLSIRTELEEREARLRSITENVSDGIYRSTPEEGLVYANRAFAEMFGYESVEAALKADPHEMYADSGRRTELRRVANERGGFDGEEVEFCRKDRSTFHGLLDTTVVRGADGEIEYYDGAVTDLTEQKRREERLRVMAQALEQAGDKVVITDRDGQIEYVNEAFETITGYREEEVVGKSPNVLQSGQHDESFYEELWDSILSGETFRAEFVNEKKDGTRYVENESISPVTGEEGRITHFVSAGRDVTEQKEREQVLRDRQEKVEALYAATDRLLRAEDEEEVGRSILNLVNEVFGYPLVVVRLVRDGQLIPIQVSPEIPEYMPPRPSFNVKGESVVARAFRENETARIEDLQAVEDPFDYGEVRAAAIVPMGEYGTLSVGDVNVGTFGDFDPRLIEVLATYASLVLDRIEREQELVEAKEEAEVASRLKSAMMANMSHEVRTPLTSINGFSEILKEELSDPRSDLAERIHRSGRRLMKTLDSVLELSRLEAGEQELKREPVRLDRVGQESTDRLRPRAKEKSIELTTRIPTAPVEGPWNEDALHRIAESLLENAVKFTPEGGRVEVRVREEGKEAVLEVEDTGVGMDPEKVPELFRAFKQESEGLSREYEGSGLGLSIARELTEALGGSVEVETKKGEGTCFAVRLPGELPPIGRTPRKGVHSLIPNKRGDRDDQTTNVHEGVQDRGRRAGRQD